jgi:hypothetical protein
MRSREGVGVLLVPVVTPLAETSGERPSDEQPDPYVDVSISKIYRLIKIGW